MKPVKAYKQCNRYAQAFIHILLFSLKTRYLNIVCHFYFKIAKDSIIVIQSFRNNNKTSINSSVQPFLFIPLFL